MQYPDRLHDIKSVLENDGTILYPTDTIWGLGCSALSSKAIEKIYLIKNRDRSKALSILVSSLEMLKSHVEDIHPRIETLLLYHQKPLTIIYDRPKSDIFPKSLLVQSSLAIRVTQDPFCHQLIESLGHPIVSTSANISDHSFPKSFEDIDQKVRSQVDYIVKHRQKERSSEIPPSPIARYDYKGNLEFLRE